MSKTAIQTAETPHSSPSLPEKRRRVIELPLRDTRLEAALEKASANRGWVIVAASAGRLFGDALTNHIVQELHEAGFSTLEVDLLTGSEAGNQLIRFDIPRLAKRLIAASQWLRNSQHLGQARMAFLATGNAAGAALWASAQNRDRVASVVSLCGRPHLAEPFLGAVRCPTLLLIHGDDPRLLHTNRQAVRRLNCPSKFLSFASGDGARHEKDPFGALSSEAVSWISRAQSSVRPPRSRWSALVGDGFGSHLKRHLVAALAFLSVFAALPSTAQTTESAQHKPGPNKDRPNRR